MRIGHGAALAVATTGLAAGVGLGFVGSHDPCLAPDPQPPPGAGAATTHNSDFENNFTDGVADDWTAFQDSAYQQQVHFIGLDRSYSGGYSQKLILPQPALENQGAGIYQQIRVVPGTIYTASVRVYLEPPLGQTFAGEDLEAWIGLDPYGEAGGDGIGIAWSEGGVTPHRWLTLATRVKAVLPVMTVVLKGVRPLARHGDEAVVWFDDVRIEGLVPLEGAPDSETGPAGPDAQMPRTFGPNLVQNSSFEQPYMNGVSAGWNRWSTDGEGIWRRSQRVGKIGGGRYDCGSLDALAEMNPKTILLYGGTPSATNPNDPGGDGVLADIVYLTETYPHLENTIFIGRPAIDANWETYKTDPAFYGRQLADQLWIKQRQFPRIDAWQGLNEPGWRDEWQTVLTFEKAFADRAHELGMKVCSLNMTSNAPGSIWRMVDENFSPSCRDLLAVTDYLGHHCHGGPSDDLMVINQSLDDPCNYALRPRRFRDLYARRGWRFPPVIATEGATATGWHDNWRPETIASDLTTMGTYLNANPWWVGYAHFVAGGSCGWSNYEIIGQGNIIRDVGRWNLNNPADAVEGSYAQMFGAGEVHPRTPAEAVPAGRFTGGINRQVAGLIPGQGYVVSCWMKYEFRGRRPRNLTFHLGVDSTGQTFDGNALTLDWGVDQIADKAPVHEVFTRVWRTFTAAGPAASIWLRAGHPEADPSFMFYVDGVEVRQLNTNRLMPVVEVSPLQINLTTYAGVDPPADSFTIRNASKIGELPYTVTDNADWLVISPSEGESSGEADTLSLIYDVTGMVPGTHQAVVTVDAPGAANPTQRLLVNLIVAAIRADFDQDGDVDESDLAHIQGCLTGPGWPATPDCLSADLDDDGDVDLSDYTLFQPCISGEGVPPMPDCLP